MRAAGFSTDLDLEQVIELICDEVSAQLDG
jgi:hypothetical protein